MAYTYYECVTSKKTTFATVHLCMKETQNSATSLIFFFIKLSKPYPAIFTNLSSPQNKIWSTRISDLFSGGEDE